MINYTQKEGSMFELRVYEILKKAEVVISEATLEFLLTLSKDDLKKLNNLALYYGSDDIFEIIGKAKIQLETKNIRELAEHWRQKKLIDPKATPPNINEVLEKEIKNLNNEINFNLSDQKSRELANIPMTNISDIPIHKNYQLDLIALQFPIFSLKLKKTAEDINFINRQNVKISLSSNNFGRATIYDSDVWLYCITKLMQINYEKGGNEHTRKGSLPFFN